jgi:hypothetical protein|nr:MAG: hypothetical protein DIU61_09185 [Bacteroidota bacterium]
MNAGRIGRAILFAAALTACSTETEIQTQSTYTGNEISYPLESASVYNMSGTVTFRERVGGTTDVTINLVGNTGTDAKLPVHLHLGDVSEEDAYVAALLQPVDDRTGRSETHLERLANETSIRYADLKNLDACIKIHLSATGEGSKIILAAGNIGSAALAANPAGRRSIGICRSE